MSEKKYGVLLVNLGTPSEPTVPAVRQFLKEFLSDARVVDLPRILWLPILYGFILTFRPKKVANNYQKIWLKDGSPLMVYSLQQQRALQQFLSENASYQTKVELAMTYGQPSIENAVDRLNDWGADEIIVLPLYPQYSHTTTSSVTDQTSTQQIRTAKKFSVIFDYHREDEYIEALAESIRPKMTENDKLIISFHGIPKRYVLQGDPYQGQCQKTADLLAEKLNLKSSQWEVAYQSRVGREEWLKPYLDERMAELPKEGTKNILVICPGFSVDCLETLEEIAMENKQLFLDSGGEQFTYIEALNATPEHIKLMAGLVMRKIKLLQD